MTAAGLPPRAREDDPPPKERFLVGPAPHLLESVNSLTGELESISAWQTTRGGWTLNELPGWQIDGYEDWIDLRARLMREKPSLPEWGIGHISPLTEHGKVTYWAKPSMAPNVIARARRHAAVDSRKKQLIAHMAAGHTLKDAREATNTSPTQYRAWRQDDLEFKAAVDRARAGITGPSHWDGTFEGARRYYFGYDSYPHHLRMIEAIESCPDGGIVMILVPPESGKTTTLSDWLTTKVGEDPNTRILYVSERSGEGSMAQKVLSTLKDRFTDPDVIDPETQYSTHIPEFIAKFGPFRDDIFDKDKPWNQNYIKVHKATGQRDYTFQACGWKSRIYGARCKWLIFDDVQSDESLNSTAKIASRIRKTFLTRPGRKGKTIFIGTRIGPGDIYEHLISEGVVDRLVIIEVMDESGNSYCPEMWPVDALADKRKKVGEEVWWTAYMMQPRSLENATFTDELIDQCKDLDLPACRKPTATETQSWRVVAGLDPALGGGNALFIAAYTYDRFAIVDCVVDYNLTRNEDIFTRVKEMCRYKFTDLVVERNAQQRGIARDQRLRDLSQIFGFRIVEHETGQSKWSFDFGVGAMAGSFIRRELIIPWADEFAEHRMKPLLDELRAWRPGLPPKLQKQDMVMAMWFAWLHWQRQKDAMDVDLSHWNARATPWKPGDMTARWSQAASARGVPAPMASRV